MRDSRRTRNTIFLREREKKKNGQINTRYFIYGGYRSPPEHGDLSKIIAYYMYKKKNTIGLAVKYLGTRCRSYGRVIKRRVLFSFFLRPLSPPTPTYAVSFE